MAKAPGSPSTSELTIAARVRARLLGLPLLQLDALVTVGPPTGGTRPGVGRPETTAAATSPPRWRLPRRRRDGRGLPAGADGGDPGSRSRPELDGRRRRRPRAPGPTGGALARSGMLLDEATAVLDELARRDGRRADRSSSRP